jgi:DNA-binding winged helix-turn-helix (wHTH) protein
VRDLEIDLASRTVTVGGEAVQLSAKEYELLVPLAGDPEHVLRKEELLRDVWSFRSLGSKHHMLPSRLLLIAQDLVPLRLEAITRTPSLSSQTGH